MIVGCGIDTEERLRFKKFISKDKISGFIELVFSPAEIKNYFSVDQELCIPIAFCCKEAIFKALGDSWTTSSIDWKDIQILFNDNPSEKNYRLTLQGYADTILSKLGNPNIISDYTYNDEFVTFEIILKHE